MRMRAKACIGSSSIRARDTATLAADDDDDDNGCSDEDSNGIIDLTQCSDSEEEVPRPRKWEGIVDLRSPEAPVRLDDRQPKRKESSLFDLVMESSNQRHDKPTTSTSTLSSSILTAAAALHSTVNAANNDASASQEASSQRYPANISLFAKLQLKQREMEIGRCENSTHEPAIMRTSEPLTECSDASFPDAPLWLSAASRSSSFSCGETVSALCADLASVDCVPPSQPEASRPPLPPAPVADSRPLPPPTALAREDRPFRHEDYEVEMLVDRREKCSALIMAGLLGEGVRCSRYTLAVGDFLWIAKPRRLTASVDPPGEEDEEEEDARRWSFDQDVVVLDCIAERKTLSDLASSLCDGRYRDQKARLRETGIPLCWYIVEAEHMTLPAQQKAITAEHIKGAMISTFVDSDMHVLRTRGLDHTIRALVQIHRQVQRRFLRRPASLPGACPPRLWDFQRRFGRKPCTTYGRLFVHQLRQIHGVSTDTACALARHFQTLPRLLDFVRQTDARYSVNFIANLRKAAPETEAGPDGGDVARENIPPQRGQPMRRIGPAVAHAIWQMFAEDF